MLKKTYAKVLGCIGINQFLTYSVTYIDFINVKHFNDFSSPIKTIKSIYIYKFLKN